MAGRGPAVAGRRLARARGVRRRPYQRPGRAVPLGPRDRQGRRRPAGHPVRRRALRRDRDPRLPVRGRDPHQHHGVLPLHPTLTRWLGAILPFGLPTVGVLLTWVMALVAAWGLFAIGNHLHDRRTGVLLATVWGLLPHAIVESMGYTEAMFTAFAAWTLLATLRRQWVAAALLSVLAGLTRPSASALFPVVVLAAFVAIVRRQDRSWRAWFALLVAPLGWLGYLGWVANRTGRLDGWFHLQHEGWGSSWDAGRYTASMTASVLAEAKVPDYLLVALVMLVSLALFAISVIDRQPWQLLMFSALMIAVSLGGSGFYNAKARFLLPAFALLLPVAGALARTKPAKMYVIVGTLAAVSAYCGGYLLLIWKFSP
ncbi:ArnT family glycosyltransferase [Catellatospora coxensis]